MVDNSFNTDESVKVLVSEMAPAVVRRREELRGGGSGDDLKGNPYITDVSAVQV